MRLSLLSLTPSETLIAVWLFAMGGSVGSFLNVVVYRLPAGLSIDRPRSHCPSCKHPIRWYDNVPILGWVMLRGRCRDCGAQFSIRYALVEAATAGLFLAIGLCEGISGGANLPLRPDVVEGGVFFAGLSQGQLAGLVAWHLLLLSTLTAAALIEYDGHRPPVRLFGPALMAGLIAPAIWPHLHPVPVVWGVEGVVAGLADGLAGLTVGLAVGLAAGYLGGPARRIGVLGASGCVGLYLGWQAALVLIVSAALVELVLRLPRRAIPLLGRISPTTWLGLGSLVWILAWNWLAGWCSWLGYVR